MNHLLKILLFISIFAGIFIAFTEREDREDLFRQIQNVHHQDPAAKARKASRSKVDAQWQETVARYREIERDQQLLMSGLNKNARNLAGNLMEMADLQSFLFASLTGRGPQGDSKRILEDMERQSAYSASLGDLTSGKKQELLERIQELQKKQQYILERSQAEYQETSKRYQRLQKEQSILASNTQRILDLQQSLLESSQSPPAVLAFQNSSKERLDLALSNQAQIIEQHRAAQAMQQAALATTENLYKQLQDQYRFLSREMASEFGGGRIADQVRLEQLLSDQRSFLADKQDHFRQLSERQQELQNLRKGLLDDFLRTAEFNKAWMADRMEQTQRQSETFIDNRRDAFKFIMDDQKFRTQQMKEQQDFTAERAREQQETLRTMQRQQERFLKDQKLF